MSSWRPGLAVLICFAVVCVAAATPPAAGAAWSQISSFGLGSQSNSVSCASAADCWAVEGGELLQSTTAGAAWTSETSLVPNDVEALMALSCPTTSVCYVTGTLTSGAPALVAIDGTTVTQVALTGVTLAPQISCFTALSCIATDGAVSLATTNGWTSWTTATLATSVYPSPALTCIVGTLRCIVGGVADQSAVMERTLNDGQTWTALSTRAVPVGSINAVDAISCATVEYCYAVGNDINDDPVVIATTNGGALWSPQTVPASEIGPLTSISCFSKTDCIAAGAAADEPQAAATTDGGATWVAETLPGGLSGGGPAVDCLTASECLAVSGGLEFTTADGGTAWTTVSLPATPGVASGLACPTATHCAAVSEDALDRAIGLTTDDGGVTWKTFTISSHGIGTMLGISCPTATLCQAITSAAPPVTATTRAQILTSTDGGLGWHLDPMTLPSGDGQTMSCPSPTTCMASGSSSLWVTTNSGASWTEEAPPGGGQYSVESASCGAPTMCVAFLTDSDGDPSVAYTSTNLGATWTATTLPASVDLIDGSSCSGLFCVATSQSFLTGTTGVISSTDGGLTWTATTLDVPADSELNAASCSTSTDCIVTGLEFLTVSPFSQPFVSGTTDAGATWDVQTVTGGSTAPVAAACFQASCIASEYAPGTTAALTPIIDAGTL
jgi:photosystem II stability/assembly factor-like uncharacterized protein